MAVAFKTALGNGAVTSSGTTVTITTTAAIAIDDFVVVRWAADNLNATTPTATCADGGNTYTAHAFRGQNATGAAGVVGGILATKATVARASGSTITVTLSGSVAHKAVYAESFTGVDNTLRNAAVLASGASTTSTVTSGSATAGDLVVGLNAVESRGAVTFDSDTTNGSWSTGVVKLSSTSGTDSASVEANGQYKIVTATGAQTFNHTNPSSTDWAAMVCVFQATVIVEPTITQGAYRFYEEGTEAGSVAMAAENTAITADTTNGDGEGHLRVRLQSTNAQPVAATDDFQLQWEKNASGSWVNADSDPLIADMIGIHWVSAFIADFGTATTLEVGQSITGDGQKLAGVAFMILREGTPTGNIRAVVRAHSGTYGTSSVGTGSPLATSNTVAASSVQTDGVNFVYVYFTFDESFTLVNGTRYVISVGSDTATYVNATNRLRYQARVGSAAGHPGNLCTRTGASTWVADGSNDLFFTLYTRAAVAPTTVVGFNSSFINNGEWTTPRLTAGSGTFNEGRVSEGGRVFGGSFGWGANNYTELVYSLRVKQANVTNGDTLRFRVLRNGATTGLTYTQTPTINVTQTLPAVTQAAYRFYADGTEAGSTAVAAQGSSYTADVTTGDVNTQLRVRLQSTTTADLPVMDDWQLQWEKNTSGTWTNVTSGVVSSYDEANDFSTTIFSSTAASRMIGQTFLGDGSKLQQARFYGSRIGSPTGNTEARLYAHTGTFGSSGIPTGAVLATSTPIDVTTISTTNGWIVFNFDGTFTLANGTAYCIVWVPPPTSTGANAVQYNSDSTSPTHPGNLVRHDGSSWLFSANDVIHAVHAAAAAVVVPYASTNLTDAAATSNRLGAGSGSFVAGKISEDGLVDDLGWDANNYTELLYSITLKAADLINADTLRFRVLRNGVTTGMTYSVMPTVSVTATTVHALAGSSSGAATTAAALVADRPLAATSGVGASTTTAALAVARPLAAISAVGLSTTTADLAVVKAPIALAATAGGLSTFSESGGAALALAQGVFGSGNYVGGDQPPANLALPNWAVTQSELLVVGVGGVGSNEVHGNPYFLLTGGGLTWTRQVEARRPSGVYLSASAIFTAVATSTTTINDMRLQTSTKSLNVCWSYAKATGFSAVGAKAAVADDSTDGVKNITFDVAPAASSIEFAVAFVNANDNVSGKNITPGTTDGWSEDFDYSGSMNVSNAWGSWQGQRKTGTTSQNVRWDDLSSGVTTTYHFAGCAIEVKAGAGGPGFVVTRGLSGGSSGISTASSTALVKAVPVTASVAGGSTAIASVLAKAIPIAASATGVSTATATTLANVVSLAATAGGSSTVGATTALITRGLAGATGGSSTTTAATAVARSLAATTSGQSTTTATLDVAELVGVAVDLAGSSGGTSTTTGALARAVPLAATIATATPPTLLHSESFNGSAGAPLPAPYVYDGFYPVMQLDGAGGAVVTPPEVYGGMSLDLALPSDCSIEWGISFSALATDTWIYFQFRMPAAAWYHGYNVVIRTEAPVARCYFLRDDGSVSGTSVNLPQLQANTNHRLRVDAQGATLTVFLDDVQINSWTDPVPLTGGKVGPYSGFSGTFYGTGSPFTWTSHSASTLGTIGVGSTAIGDLSVSAAPVVALAGSTSGISTASGALAKAIPVAASVAGVSTTTALAPLVARALAGTSTASSTVTATTLARSVPLTAPTISGSSTVTATALVSVIGLAGSVTGVSTATSALAAARPLTASTVNGTSTVTGTLAATRPLAATSAIGGSTATGNLIVAKTLVASGVAGVSTTTGAFIVARALAASAAGTSATSANMVSSAAGGLAAFVVGAGTATGSLGVNRAVAGSANGISTASATTVAKSLQLTATAGGLATPTASVAVARALVGSTSGASTTTGSFVGAVSLAGSASGTAVTTAALARAVPLAAFTIVGGSTTTAAVRVALGLAGSSVGLSTATANTRVALALAASSSGLSTADALPLDLVVGLAGSIDGLSTVEADLAVFLIVPTYGIWNGQVFEEMQYGDKQVVDWILTPP